MSVRVGFEFRVQQEKLTEYLHVHNPVADDMLNELHRAGMRNYSIFHAGGGRMIGTYETDDLDATNAYLTRSEAARLWDQQMRPFFALNEGEPVVRPLTEVFHLDSQYAATL